MARASGYRILEGLTVRSSTRKPPKESTNTFLASVLMISTSSEVGCGVTLWNCTTSMSQAWHRSPTELALVHVRCFTFRDFSKRLQLR